MDFANVAGPLGVSHFLILSRSQTHVNLRICRLPRGPTVTFHITGVSERGRERGGCREESEGVVKVYVHDATFESQANIHC